MEYYRTNGVSSITQPMSEFWIGKTFNGYLMSFGDKTIEIESLIDRFHEMLENKITYNNYWQIINNSPDWIFWFLNGGIDSESNITKDFFEETSNKYKDNELMNRLLYLYDCKNLIFTIQNSINETKSLLGLFYEIFNTETFLVTIPNKDGIQYAAGTHVMPVFSVVNSLFTRLYSLLDFITKLAYEIENLQSDFGKYPKLKSKNVLFGNGQFLKIGNTLGSIYEKSDNLQMIINIRNEIVHNLYFDSLPKIYQNIKEGETVEKYILLPDMLNGNFVRYKNRKRFFSGEIKLNEILPQLVIDFWGRTYKTIELVIAQIN